MTTYKTQKWVNGQGSLQGHPAHIRKNSSLGKVQMNSHPYALIVNLAYHDLTNDGLPQNEDELCRLDRTEEAVADRFVAEYGAQFAMVVTSGGTRDLFLFLPRSVSDQEVDGHIQSTEPEVDYDFSVHHDPNWEPYADLMPL